MAECLLESDVEELGRQIITDFDRRIESVSNDLCAPFHAEARALEAQLLTVYRMTVMCVRKEEDMDRVAARWGKMVEICNESLSRLQALSDSHPGCGADIYCERVFQLRGKCQRLQEMHR